MAEYKLRIQMDLDITFEHDDDKLEYFVEIDKYPEQVQDLIKNKISLIKDDILNQCYVSMCYNNTELQEARSRISGGLREVFESSLFDKMLAGTPSMGLTGCASVPSPASDVYARKVSGLLGADVDAADKTTKR